MLLLADDDDDGSPLPNSKGGGRVIRILWVNGAMLGCADGLGRPGGLGGAGGSGVEKVGRGASKRMMVVA